MYPNHSYYRVLKQHGQCTHSCHSVSRSPLRVLFFGSDAFAVESLKHLHASSLKANEGVVDSLEVVTLSHAAPVWKYASLHKLRVHDWPNLDVHGCFDVGIVVSFGCLLKEGLIAQFPHGILNVHPSLLPRWRGPAPIYHTILQGDPVTGVSIMQIRPRRFDVGPILQQQEYEVPPRCTADELGKVLATLGAKMLMDTLKNLPERIANRREQANDGASFAGKIRVSMSWLMWEDHTCTQIERLYRALSSRIPLRTTWMGAPVKLLDFVGECNVSLTGYPSAVPGTIYFQKEKNCLAVRCKDGWVGFKTVKLKKQLSALDFYNGYLHQSVLGKSPTAKNCVFHSPKQNPDSCTKDSYFRGENAQ